MAALQRIGIGRTRADRLAIDEHRARAARALGAAVLDGGEVQRVAQIAQQLLIFRDLRLAAVDVEYSHGLFSLRANSGATSQQRAVLGAKRHRHSPVSIIYSFSGIRNQFAAFFQNFVIFIAGRMKNCRNAQPGGASVRPCQKAPPSARRRERAGGASGTQQKFMGNF